MDKEVNGIMTFFIRKDLYIRYKGRVFFFYG